MTSERWTQVIADYQADYPWPLIAHKHGVAWLGLRSELNRRGIPMRGRQYSRVGNRNVSRFWKGFVIKPQSMEAASSRIKALSMIRIKEFNPIGTL